MHSSVGAIIKQDNKILMVDRKNIPLGWACPAGHHEIIILIDTEISICNPELIDSLEHCETFGEIDLDKDHFSKISESDAILVLNYPKNNINGYVGGATLMEIAVARHLDKKIFILFDLPDIKELKYVLEIKLAKPIILKGDIDLINSHNS